MVKKATKKATSKKAAKSTDPSKTLDLIKSHIAEIDGDYSKFEQGQKAAARRMRKAAMEIKRACGVFRKGVTNTVKEM